MPTWLRIAVIVGAILLVGGAGLFAYRWYARPTSLALAAGSADGEAGKIVALLEGKLAQSNARVRLKLVPMPGPVEAAKAFSTGSVDLAVVRGDIGDLADARAILRDGDSKPEEESLDALYGLGYRIRTAGRQTDLDHIEEEIDLVLRKQRQRAKSEGDEQRDVAAVNVAAHRLENLIHDRRIALASQQGGQALG